MAVVLGVATHGRGRSRWPCYGGVLATAFYVVTTAPWIESKALASASPILLTVSLAGIAAVFEGGRRSRLSSPSWSWSPG